MKKLVNKIFCGDASNVLSQLPSDSIDCVVTSPPYWALRDYGLKPQIWDEDKDCEHDFITITTNRKPSEKGVISDKAKWGQGYRNYVQGFCSKCNAWKGQLGLEPTFDLFIKHLCDIFDEVKRVLKKEGTCWVNLGDTYSGSHQGSGKRLLHDKENLGSLETYKQKYGHTLFQQPLNAKTQIGDKNLCLIPFRFAIEMQSRGWILRNVIIWHKPNCMPSSVKDRFTVDFEYLFFFVKNKNYWFEVQHEPLKEATFKRIKYPFNKNKGDIASAVKTSGIKTFQEKVLNKERLYRNKRCIWTITTKPYKESHFAVFPPQLVEIPIMAGCPEFVCKKCGKARKKIFNTTTSYLPYRHPAGKQPGKIFSVNAPRWESKTDFIGYTDCGCNAGFKPGIVLDPFSGSGTTLAVAKSLNRNYIGIDLNPEYIKMAQRRIAKLDENKNI